jgi:1-deoxy-D-xylulose-5-phosphate reductoisomerase
MSYPGRIHSAFPRFDFLKYPALTFEPPDLKVFRNLALANEAIERGGNFPCILNAANEAAVAAFLKERISFMQMPGVIEHCLRTITFASNPKLADLIDAHHVTLLEAEAFISRGCR